MMLYWFLVNFALWTGSLNFLFLQLCELVSGYTSLSREEAANHINLVLLKENKIGFAPLYFSFSKRQMVSSLVSQELWQHAPVSLNQFLIFTFCFDKNTTLMHQIVHERNPCYNWSSFFRCDSTDLRVALSSVVQKMMGFTRGLIGRTTMEVHTNRSIGNVSLWDEMMYTEPLGMKHSMLDPVTATSWIAKFK